MSNAQYILFFDMGFRTFACELLQTCIFHAFFSMTFNNCINLFINPASNLRFAN